MPPKKKHTHKARKAELIFLECPREGPLHSWESLPRLAENPRHVPTKPVDHNTSTAWVCPQFETLVPVSLKGCQKSHRAQNWDANHSSLHQGGAGGACQKVTPCKFPPLTFETSEGHVRHFSDHPDHSKKKACVSHRQPPKRTVAKANMQADSSPTFLGLSATPVAQPVGPEVSSCPDTPTQNPPPGRNWSCSSTLAQMSGPAWLLHNMLAPNIDPPGGDDLSTVLVADTPEHAYGVKVTWRQRPHILQYLRERGRLTADDIFVKMNPPWPLQERPK